jgi:lipopolysaccharide export LptBFGC system permease protein LptF
MAREWATWFLGCLVFLVGTIFLFSIVEDFGQVFPRGLEYWGEDFFYWLLTYLPWLLPICCLGASLFSLSFARKRGEWTAMLANGISPMQSFILITVIGVCVGLTSDWLMKHSGNRSMDINDIRARSLKMQIGQDRLWYFKSFDPSTFTGNDLQLFSYGSQGEDVLRIRANRAGWDSQDGWTFYDGRFLGFHSSLGLPIIDNNKSALKWEKDFISGNEGDLYQTKSPGLNRTFDRLTDIGFKDDPSPYLWLQKRPKDMSALEINRLLDRFPNPQNREMIPYRLRKAQLWWNGPACLVALLIGLGLGSSRGSSTPAKLAGVSLLGALGFYLARTLSDSLGEQQILSPMLSASLPYCLVILGAVLFFKMQK